MTGPARTVADHAAFLAPRGFTVKKPFGPGPFPVAVQMHGCAGSQPFQHRYADDAVRAGAAVVIVDSLKPRGMTRTDGSLFVCSGMTLRGAQRAADLHAVLHWLKEQSWADSGRVFAAGWSHGGWTIMDALAQGEAAARMTGLTDARPGALRAIRGTLLVYPYAAFPSLTSRRGWGEARPKVFSILGGRDQVVGVKHPQKSLERLRRDGLQVDTLLLPEATHAFDDDDANDPRTKYRKDYEDQARAYYAAALRTAFA